MPAACGRAKSGASSGLELPILAMEHQYVITGEIPEVVASPKEMLHVIDFEGEIYMRQEGRGMLIGTYEKAGVPWAERETPWDFTHALLPHRPRPHRAQPRSRLPAFPGAGARGDQERSSTDRSRSRPTAIR